MAKGFKYFTVWAGYKTGVFTNWPECELATKGYSGQQYKGFKTLEEAEKAFEQGYYGFYGIQPPDDALNEPKYPDENPYTPDTNFNSPVNSNESPF